MNWIHVSSLLCLLLYVKEGLGMSCYQCDSRNDPDCKEFFDHANLASMIIRPLECKVDASEYCVKTTGVWGGVVGTTRFCSSRDMGNQCQYIRYPDHDRVYRACIYTCSGTACNTATSVSYSGLLMLLVASVMILLRRL